MRRMYSEQELTNIIKAVFDEEVESGVFDEPIADYIDEYLTEHPVDPTAITGLDIAPKDVTASGNITAPSIIETMTGYSFEKQTITGITLDYVYAGVVKNGNKITFVIACDITRDSATGSITIGVFNAPSAVLNQIYNSQVGAGYFFDLKVVNVYKLGSQPTAMNCFAQKSAGKLNFGIYNIGDLTANEKYYFRYEVTLLLSENLISNE